MSWGDAAVGQQKYYDAAEVEEYIEKVTATVQRLQAELRDQARRADQAEQQLRAARSEPAETARALQNQTVAEAEARAADIVRDAQRRAGQLVEDARTERDRLIDSARRTAWEQAHDREVRLLASVNTFVQRSRQLRDDLQAIETEAAEWRLELATSTAGGAPPSTARRNDSPGRDAPGLTAPTWLGDDDRPPPPRRDDDQPPPPRRDKPDGDLRLPSRPAVSIPPWPPPTQDPLR